MAQMHTRAGTYPCARFVRTAVAQCRSHAVKGFGRMFADESADSTHASDVSPAAYVVEGCYAVSRLVLGFVVGSNCQLCDKPKQEAHGAEKE